MNKVILLVLSVLILFSGVAVAADATWHGVWSGTIGKQQVMVCLDDPDSSSYYYRSHSNGISLSAKDKAGARWTEMSKGKKTGEWKFDSISRNRITGNWLTAKGKHPVPVVLERVNTSPGGQLCESEAYNQPRIESTKIDVGKPKLFEGKRYRELSAFKISTIELMEDGPNAAAINKALRAELRDEITNYFQCYEYVNTREKDIADSAEYSVHKTPVFWTSRWLTLSVGAESDCGGAHPNHGHFYETWNLERGKSVELWSWFVGGDKKEASAALNKVIVAHANVSTDMEECAEVITNNTDYSLCPGKKA